MKARPGLMRSREDRILGGVCGGIAEWLGWSSTTVRILFVLISVLSAAFPGILVYVLLWLFMPEREEDDA
jgi:phage shock protein PspC (stress-responsive transcriptional regulator)